MKRHSAADAWEGHADWYHARHGRDGDRHHRELIIPAVLRHLPICDGMRILDCCCGQGVVARQLARQGAQVDGLDGSETLIAAARELAGERESYKCGDAHAVQEYFGEAVFDAGLVVLALQDLDPIDDVCRGLAAVLKPGAALIVVLTHPCFRIPRHSDWYFDRKQQQQKRVLDQYLSVEQIEIQVAGEQGPSQSQHYHRPLQFYLRALGRAGLAVLDAEELCSPHRGSSGSRSAAEDQAQREFPIFLLLKAQRLQVPVPACP